MLGSFFICSKGRGEGETAPRACLEWEKKRVFRTRGQAFLVQKDSSLISVEEIRRGPSQQWGGGKEKWDVGSFRSLYLLFRKDLSGAEKGKYSDRERGNQREISFFDMFYRCSLYQLTFEIENVFSAFREKYPFWEEEVREIKKDVLAGSYVFSPLKLVVLPNKITPF